MTTIEPVSKETLGPLGFTKQFKNSLGYNIFGYFWPAQNSKKIAILIHGHGTHVPYEYLRSTGTPGKQRVYKGSWVEELNAHGYSCCGIDVQSFGRSEGYNKTRSYFNSFQDLVNDVKEFVSKLPELGGEKYSDLPKFIFGISMGGCIAVNMLQQCPNDYMGALLFAPMLSLERLSKEGLNPYLKPLVSVVNTLGPTLRMAHTPKNVKFPHLQKEFENDILCDTKYTRVRCASEYLKTTENLCKNFKDITAPFITFHSEDDTFVDPEGSRKLFEESSSSIKEYVNAKNMWHLLLHEDGNRDLLKKSIGWMESFDTKGP